MDYQWKPPGDTWDRLRELDERSEAGEVITMDAPTRDVILRGAASVGMSAAEAQAALATPEAAAGFVHEARRRIREGSRRLGEALIEVAALVEQGRLSEARAVLRALIEAEPVPFYREIAASELARLDRPGAG